MSEFQNWKVVFMGRVQGVGFRYTVATLARQFQVVGYVRNLSSGDVELQAEGNSQELENFIELILSERRDYISDHRVTKSAPTHAWNAFLIN